MKDMQFPIFKTKIENSRQFDLTDVEQRKQYFELKAGDEIKRLREWLRDNTFIAYMLGKKNSGKGTYAKMLKEIVSKDRIEHFSIGDMARELDEVVRDEKKKQKLVLFLENNYRGFLPLEDIVKSLEQRKEKGTKALLSSELILTLVKMKITQTEEAGKPARNAAHSAAGGRKALFIDGFPRGLDQISYSLFFRDLIGYRDDPDVFILIDVPENVIDERIKQRVICPQCQTSRGLKLLPTKTVGYDKAQKEFYLICDNPACQGARMIKKEGDELGIASQRDRLKTDADLIKKAFSLHGIPKVFLRNSVPVVQAKEYVDDYEITPVFDCQFESGKVETIEKPWEFEDDQGVVSHSLMPPPVVVSLVKQLVEVLDV